MSTGGGFGGGPLLSGVLGQLTEDLLKIVTIFTTAGMVEMIFYGIHFVLFWTCILLLSRIKRSAQWFILVSAVVMFLLSTADIACTFQLLSHDLNTLLDNRETNIIVERILQAKDTLFVASNLFAELILLYRCYIVWDRSAYALTLCAICVMADTIWGFIAMGPSILTVPTNRFVAIYVWSIFAINILITSITIFRIFWVSRIANRLVGQRHPGGYQTAIAILIESSVIYSGCLLIYLLLSDRSPNRFYLIVISMRVVGIMPTLLVVQIGFTGLKQQVNVPTTMSQFQAGTKSAVLDTLGPSMFQDTETADASSASDFMQGEVENPAFQYGSTYSRPVALTEGDVPGTHQTLV